MGRDVCEGWAVTASMLGRSRDGEALMFGKLHTRMTTEVGCLPLSLAPHLLYSQPLLVLGEGSAIGARSLHLFRRAPSKQFLLVSDGGTHGRTPPHQRLELLVRDKRKTTGPFG